MESVLEVCNLLVYLNHFNLDFEKESHYLKQVHVTQNALDFLKDPIFGHFINSINYLLLWMVGWLGGYLGWRLDGKASLNSHLSFFKAKHSNIKMGKSMY